MKSIAAIGFFLLLLFNLCGYRLVVNWLQTGAVEQLQSKIDKGNYNEANLVELSVVTNLPYTNDWLDWEQVEGTIEINGIHYQYVEKKLEKGSMHYRCLPNTDKQNLISARDEFFQLVNNFNQQSDNSTSKTVIISNYIGDYDNVFSTPYHFGDMATTIPSTTPMPYAEAIVNVHLLIPHQPPEC